MKRAPESFAARSVTWQAALTAATGLHAHAILPVHSLPRTSSGKLKRYRLAEDYAAGKFDSVLAAISSQGATAGSEGGTAVERRLMEICRGLFPGHALSTDQNLFELGADSLTLVRIHEEIESLYPGRVAVTDLFDHPTIAALADYIDGQSA